MKKIIYILSSGHSGSTVLGSLLGNLHNAFHIGEFSNFYNVYSGTLETCSCKKTLQKCELWSKVISELDPAVIEQYEKMRLEVETSIFNKPNNEKYKQLQEITDRIYKVISEFSGSEIIIDSSKSPNRAYLLSKIYGKNLFIIYLKRDFKGVVNSYIKKRGDFNFNKFVVSLFKEHIKNKYVKLKSKSNFYYFNYEGLTNQTKVNNLIKKLKIDSTIDIKTELFNHHVMAGNRLRYQKSFHLKPNTNKYSYSFYQTTILNLLNFIRFVL